MCGAIRSPYDCGGRSECLPLIQREKRLEKYIEPRSGSGETESPEQGREKGEGR